MKILEMKKINKVFAKFDGSPQKALDDVNMHVKRGENVGIVGQSGSGKSTLAKLVTKLISPNSGEIFFNGDNVTRISKKELREYYTKVQMVFQNPLDTFSPRMSIGTYLIQPALNYNTMSKEDALDQAKNLLEDVGLDASFIEKYPSELSGGELQRVVVARVLSLEPELVIFDECTSALDASIQKRIMDLIKDLKRTVGFTGVFITHDLALAYNVCDRIYVMNEGRIVEVLHRDKFNNPQEEYTKKLMDSVLKI